LEFNVPFQHKYGYIRDEALTVDLCLMSSTLCHVWCLCDVSNSRPTNDKFTCWLDHQLLAHMCPSPGSTICTDKMAVTICYAAGISSSSLLPSVQVSVAGGLSRHWDQLWYQHGISCGTSTWL